MVVSSNLSSAEILAEYCHKIYDKGLSPGTSGNVSIREEERVYITPSGCCLGEVEPSEMIEMSLDGEKLAGLGRPSSEWVIHQEIYQVRPDIHAVVHAHPPKASGLAAAHRTIDQPLIAEGVYHLGEVPLVPYYLPGTETFASAIGTYIVDAKALILANHGVMTVGSFLCEAYFHLELLENLAEVYIIANTLPGGAKPLSKQDVEVIRVQKQQMKQG
jgi:L-fuculose-phosphate aldolase